jgi:hypothetical protein
MLVVVQSSTIKQQTHQLGAGGHAANPVTRDFGGLQLSNAPDQYAEFGLRSVLLEFASTRRRLLILPPRNDPLAENQRRGK